MMIGNTNYGEFTFRGSSAASLASENPVPAAFEPIAATDGTDFIFKIGDGVRPWNDLPAFGAGGGGGGGVIGSSESWTSPTPLRASGEGGIEALGIVWGAPYSPDGGTDAGIESWSDGRLGLADPGWYAVVVSVDVRHPDTSAVTYVRCALNVGDSLAGNHETFLAPVRNGSTDVFSALINLGPVYSDGTAYIRPDVRWNTGVYTATGAQLGAHVVRLS